MAVQKDRVTETPSQVRPCQQPNQPSEQSQPSVISGAKRPPDQRSQASHDQSKDAVKKTSLLTAPHTAFG